MFALFPVRVETSCNPAYQFIALFRNSHYYQPVMRCLQLSLTEILAIVQNCIRFESLPKIMIHWKPEGRKKRGRPRRTWKDGIYAAMNERDLRMGEWNNRRQWNMKVGRRRQTF